MSRLAADTATVLELYIEWGKSHKGVSRLGQFLWNRLGRSCAAQGEAVGWPELFYEENPNTALGLALCEVNSNEH